MLQILFTCSNTLGSHLIRLITEAPVSHCAIRYGEFVLHATEGGVILTTLDAFCKENTIIYQVDVSGASDDFFSIAETHLGQPYDYPGLVFLGIRYLLKALKLPYIKVNLWQSSGMFMCTELVSAAILGKADSLITPYQLYIELNKMEKRTI